jgi:hypothetical protein
MRGGTVRGEQTRTRSRAPSATSTFALGTDSGYALGAAPSFGLGATVTFALDPVWSLIFSIATPT